MKRKRRNVPIMGFSGMRAAAVNAPTVTYSALPDTESYEVKQFLTGRQQQVAEQNEKAKQNAIVYEQKRKEYLQEQADKESKRQKRENIVQTVGSTLGTVVGAEFGPAGMALGNLLGGLAGGATNALINLF